MRTSRRLLRQARRAVLIAFLFSGCINILMLATPIYTLQIFETVVPTGSIETLVVLTLMVCAAVFALTMIELCRDRILLRVGLWLDHSLGELQLQNGLKHKLDHDRILQDAKALAVVRSFLMSPGLAPLFDLPFVPMFLIVLTLCHPLLGAAAAVASVFLVFAAIAQSVLTNRLMREGQKAEERSSNWLATIAAQGPLVSGLALTSGAVAQWESLNRAHVAAAYSVGKRSSLVKAFGRATRIAAQVALYGIGAWLVIRGEVAPGVLVASAILLARVLGPLEHCVSMLRTLQMAWAAYGRLKALPPDAVVPEVHTESDRPQGHVSIVNASYYHPGRRLPALKSVSLELRPGDCVGLVGANGSGKSTLAAILAGAIVPATGAADLDGVPIAKWQNAACDPVIGYLPDEPNLIEGTVHQNITRFRDESLMAAARAGIRAGVHEILAALPQGYDTLLAAGGSGLALRERRAIALARAVHGAPRFVVLDEPELGLDGASLKQLIGVLEALKAEGIGLVIATQDPRLLSLTDKIVVLNSGAIEASGPRAEIGRKVEAARRAAQPTLVAVAGTN